MSKVTFFRDGLSLGLVARNVSPYSRRASLFLNLLSPIIHKCHHCGDKAVRVGAFARLGRKNQTEFRGLCERHKNFGRWNNE